MTINIIAASHDHECGCMYLYLSENRSVRTGETRAGVLIDYDAEGEIGGIEILDAYNDTSHERFNDALHAIAVDIWSEGYEDGYAGSHRGNPYADMETR